MENFSGGVPDNLRAFFNSVVELDSSSFYQVDMAADRIDLGPNVRQLTTTCELTPANLGQPQALAAPAATDARGTPSHRRSQRSQALTASQVQALATASQALVTAGQVQGQTLVTARRTTQDARWEDFQFPREAAAARDNPSSTDDAVWEEFQFPRQPQTAATDGSSGSSQPLWLPGNLHEQRQAAAAASRSSQPATLLPPGSTSGSPDSSQPQTAATRAEAAATSAEAAATTKRARRDVIADDLAVERHNLEYSATLADDLAERHNLDYSALQERMRVGTGHFTPADYQLYYVNGPPRGSQVDIAAATGETTAATSVSAAQIYGDSQCHADDLEIE